MNTELIKNRLNEVLNECGEQLSEDCLYLLALSMSEYMDDIIETRKTVRDDLVRLISRKRALPELHGKKLHAFKNEFNTMFQTLGKLKFEDVIEPAIYKLCLNFAWWGANNLKTENNNTEES